MILFSEESLHGEEASILRSLTGKRKLDSIGNDVQIWELSPSTSPVPKYYGRGERERFRFFNHSSVDNIDKRPSPSPNITDALMDLKEESSMRLLGQLDAIVNRNNSTLFVVDDAVTDNQEQLASKHKNSNINGNHSNVEEVPMKAFKKKNNFKTYDETVDNFLDAPTPIEELSKESADGIPGQELPEDEVRDQETTSEEQKDKSCEVDNDKSGYFTKGDIIEECNKNETDKSDDTEINISGRSDIWAGNVEHEKDVEVGREGSPGSSPASHRRGNFRAKRKAGSKTGNNIPQLLTTKTKLISSNGFAPNGDVQAKEKVKTQIKIHVLPSVAELEPSTSPTEQISSMPQDLHIAAASGELRSVSTTNAITHKGQQRNATPERTAGASNVTVNDHTQQTECTQTETTLGNEANLKETNTNNNSDQNNKAAGIDPSHGNNTNTNNTLVNVLRRRVRSEYAADPVCCNLSTGAAVGSPTPFRIVSPVGNAPPPVCSGSQQETIVTQVQLQLANDSVQNTCIQHIGLETSGMVSTASTVSSNTNIAPAALSNNDSGSSSAAVEGVMPEGAPSTATTSLTSFSIHSQPPSSETSNSRVTATPHSNLPLSNSEQISSTLASSLQEITQQQQNSLDKISSAVHSPDFKQLNFHQGYTEGSNNVTGIPLSVLTSGVPVSVVGGRVIGPGGLPIIGPGGLPITVRLNGTGSIPGGGDLMQVAAGINLDQSLLGPEDLLAMEMLPAVGSSEPAVLSNSISTGQAAAGASGGSPDTAAQVRQPLSY